MTLLDFIVPEFEITNKIRLIELFAGVGSQAMALRNIRADFEHYRVVEFDKFAIASYNAIHGTNFPTMDITEIKGKDLGIEDADEFTYILTYSFPCQDLSLAGAGAGMSRESGTRSGLLWEVERLLNETENLPQVLLMENVPQVIGQKHIADFHEWQSFLEDKGYSNYTDTLNAKYYGVAQNRNRTFMVSILGEWNYHFPKPIALNKTIKDYLEQEVDERFYINNSKAQELILDLVERGELEGEREVVDATLNDPSKLEVMNTITARYDSGIQNYKSIGGMVAEPKIKQLGNIVSTGKWDDPQRGRIYSSEGVSPALNTVGGGGLEPKIVEERKDDVTNTITTVAKDNWLLEPSVLRKERNEYGKAIRKEYEAGEVDESRHNMSHHVPRPDGVSNTITTVQKDNWLLEPTLDYVGSISDKDRVGDGKNLSRNAPEGEGVYDSDGIAKTQTSDGGGVGGTTGLYLVDEPIRVKQATKKGYIECEPGGMTAPTLTAEGMQVHKVESVYRIRRLTPLECWRLMGFTDGDFYKAEAVNSNTQLYKQAGNSIVVDVLEGIFRNLNIKQER